MLHEIGHNDRQTHPSEYHKRSAAVVVLDVTLNDYRSLKTALCVVGGHNIFYKTDFDECFDFLTSSDQCYEEIYLLISHLFIHITRDVLCDIIPQIKRVYIIEPPSDHDVTLVESKKFRGPFRDICLLVKTILSDHEQGVRRSTFNVLEHSVEYIWRQFFYNVVMRIRNNIGSLSEWCEKIRNEIRSSKTSFEDKFRTLLEVEQFEQAYHPIQVISEYTKDSFFHRHLNKALCQPSKTMNTIVRHRSILYDLFHTLNEKKVVDNTPQRLYRGQRADLDEIMDWKNNIGNVFSFRSFLSTTYRMDIAQIFAGVARDNGNDPRNQLVIYVISADLRTLKTLYANLGINSEEEEHLFAPEGLFRIDDVQHIEKVCYLHITLLNQDHPLVHQIIDYWENILGEHSLSSIAYEQPVLYYTPFGFRALLYMIQNCDRTELARNETIEVMREYNATKCTGMRIIDESAILYQADRAIDWYMEDECLYNLLMKSLENHDINKIFKLRYLIADIFTQFSRIRQDQSDWYEVDEDMRVSFYCTKIREQTTMKNLYNEFHQRGKWQHSEILQTFRQFLTASTSLYDIGRRVGIDFEKKEQYVIRGFHQIQP